MMKLLLGLVGLVIGLYLILTLALFTFQRRLIYPTSPTRHSPSEAGLDIVREVTLKTPDGEQLVAWYAPAQPGRPTLLYFHGNGGTLLIRADRIRRFLGDGLGVFMPAYRGYSGSTGSPSEAALIADAKLAYDHLTGMGLRAEQIVAYGESLGSGVAVQLAASRQTAGVVLDAPYSSLLDVAQRRYSFIPVKPFLLDTFASDAYIANVKAPVLICTARRTGSSRSTPARRCSRPPASRSKWPCWTARAIPTSTISARCRCCGALSRSGC
jgi:uncharacterized protein